MDYNELSVKLIEAFSAENLNHISSKIINLHKRKNVVALQKLAQWINKYQPIDPENKTRLFSNLIILFHPDKGLSYQKEITKAKNREELLQFQYILEVLPKIDQLGKHNENPVMDPDAFEAEYGWNYQPAGEDYFFTEPDEEPRSYWFDEENPDQNRFYDEFEPANDATFLSALKRKIYGPTYIDFPVHLLEDMEEIEMAEYEIEELDGIEFCTYVLFLDLSFNSLTDISMLSYCSHLEELYLGSNQIHYIDVLQNLTELRRVDLSLNKISDIGPLLNLQKLEFVNLLGNQIPEYQIKGLKNRGIVVIY